MSAIPHHASVRIETAPERDVVQLASASRKLDQPRCVTILLPIGKQIAAVVVDENAPYVWRGAGAGAAWWNTVADVVLKAHITNLRPTDVRNGEFKSSATDAYLVQSMMIRGIRAGKPFAEAGTMTYTFHNSDGTWFISTMVWTTKP